MQIYAAQVVPAYISGSTSVSFLSPATGSERTWIPEADQLPGEAYLKSRA